MKANSIQWIKEACECRRHCWNKISLSSLNVKNKHRVENLEVILISYFCNLHLEVLGRISMRQERFLLSPASSGTKLLITRDCVRVYVQMLTSVKCPSESIMHSHMFCNKIVNLSLQKRRRKICLSINNTPNSPGLIIVSKEQNKNCNHVVNWKESKRFSQVYHLRIKGILKPIN